MYERESARAVAIAAQRVRPPEPSVNESLVDLFEVSINPPVDRHAEKYVSRAIKPPEQRVRQ